MIEFIEVSYDYYGQIGVKDINLKIEEGRWVSLIGANGSGKTTLLKLINGLLKPKKGDVLVDGINTKNVKTSFLSRKVGFVFQNPDYYLFSNSVLDEVMFAPRNFKSSDPRRCAKEAIDRLGLNKYVGRSPLELSEGERERVAIASVLSYKPKYILLDEPTKGMDYRRKLEFSKILMKLIEDGHTVVVASHDVEWVADNSDKIAVLHKGEIIANGPMELLSKDVILNKASLIKPQTIEICETLDLEVKCRFKEVSKECLSIKQKIQSFTR
ncbi:MAG: ABC transporter ATP-binding protein [archaeon]|nr:ABC transporter ATP-binding protein [archaeon]MCP8315609.1 ABC transporter ATP-binding protein [archaeon]MCP8320719.1 ABC transporter ATP-binding protein [archaeon]